MSTLLAGTVFDMRSLPGGSNFRSGFSMNSKVGNDGFETFDFDNGNKGNITSKSYYMNKDYLFTNNLASPVPLGVVNYKSFPEIQTLIINEFQPNDVFSIADLIPDAGSQMIQMIGDVADSAVGNYIKMGKYFLTNSMIRKVSKDPSCLYASGSRERHYFTSDPVQQIHNMFWRRQMAQYI